MPSQTRGSSKAARGRRRHRVGGCDVKPKANESLKFPPDVDMVSHFTLGDEARNTELHHRWDNTGSKLRYSRVSFICAGTSGPEELTQIPQQRKDGKASNESSFSDSAGEAATFGVESATKSLNNTTINDPAPRIEDDMNHEAISIDENVSKSFANFNGNSLPSQIGVMRPVASPSSSPTLSEASEEKIVFTGRRNRQTSRAHVQAVLVKENEVSQKELNPYAISSKSEAETAINPMFEASGRAEIKKKTSTGKMRFLPKTQNLTSLRPSSAKTSKPRKPKAKNRRTTPQPPAQSPQAVVDHVANIDADDHLDLNHEFYRRDLGGSGTGEWLNETNSSTCDEISNVVDDVKLRNSPNLPDLDSVSTSDEALEEISKVSKKRERTSGVQDLVVEIDCLRDNVHWLPISTSSSPKAAEMVKMFEENQAKLDHPINESVDPKTLRIEKRAIVAEDPGTQLTDEHIAQLLAKQEELGLGSSDLILFDGIDFPAPRNENLKPANAPCSSPSLEDDSMVYKDRPGQKTIPLSKALVGRPAQELYDGFDIMDQDRPSLRKRPKGRHADFLSQLSDSELEQTMYKTWERDRAKKKARKQEREELRAQGLLGKKEQVNLKAKYSEGVSWASLKKEIRKFLLSEFESLSLPPMDKHQRKLVHEVAGVFDIKSKSTGAGSSRFITLNKTARTVKYDEEALNGLNSMPMFKRFSKRPNKEWGTSTLSRRGQGRRFALAGVSYRDGEVVGAAAPELGLENRGRAMLEKMGWNQGSALGPLNSDRGIVQPVPQVVKTTKAGLG